MPSPSGVRRIAVVNPNTTESMTATIAVAARAVVEPSTEVLAITNAHGPASIESHYDEALAVPGLLASIAAGAADVAGARRFGRRLLDLVGPLGHGDLDWDGAGAAGAGSARPSAVS